MSYKIETQKGKEYALVEVQTGFVVKKAKETKSLKPLKKFYSSGGGFAGFTPEFMQKPVPKHLLKV